jgi:hypothetical protein
MSTHPSLIGTFSIGDEITVVGQSKHRGRTATVKKVGKRRLTVKFHDKQRGTYVDCDNARIIDNARITDHARIIDNATTISDDTKVNDLSAVLEQLAITTAIAIKSQEPATHSRLVHDFIQSLDQHLGVVQQDKV